MSSVLSLAIDTIGTTLWRRILSTHMCQEAMTSRRLSNCMVVVPVPAATTAVRMRGGLRFHSDHP